MRPCQTPLARYLLVCTGGIGENDASTRAFIGEGLEALGIRTAAIRVMQAQEEEQIAWRTWQLTQQPT